jgi:quercetin dioxygenase-like cupin family protein
MPKTTVDTEREYGDEKFTAKEVFRTERSKTICGFFEPGQFIPVHAPDSDLTVVVQSGNGVVRDGEQTHDVSPGDVVTVPAGTDRGIRADGERLEAVLVVAPPPTDAEHEPVRRGLKQGNFEPK